MPSYTFRGSPEAYAAKKVYNQARLADQRSLYRGMFTADKPPVSTPRRHDFDTRCCYLAGNMKHDVAARYGWKDPIAGKKK